MSTNPTFLKQQPGESIESYVERLERELLLSKSSTIIESVNNIVETINNPPIIASPAIPNSLQKFNLHQPVAFINSRLDVVPGTITKLNSDSTFNLEVFIPTATSSIKFDTSNASFKRKHTTELKSQPRLRCRPADVRTIYQKQSSALAEAQRGTDGIVQTHINSYVPVGTVHTPKFHDFHTSLVGTFFDPSQFFYHVMCWRPEMEIEGQKFPAETLSFPKSKPYYENFFDAFQRYFKEHYKGMSKSGSKWNRVEIQVSLKEDILE